MTRPYDDEMGKKLDANNRRIDDLTKQRRDREISAARYSDAVARVYENEEELIRDGLASGAIRDARLAQKGIDDARRPGFHRCLDRLVYESGG